MKLDKVSIKTKGWILEEIEDANKPTKVEPEKVEPVLNDEQKALADREEKIKRIIAKRLEANKKAAEETKAEDHHVEAKPMKEQLCKTRKEVAKVVESLKSKGIKWFVSRVNEGDNRYKVSYKLNENDCANVDIEALEWYVKNFNEGDNITVTADLLNVLEQSLEMYKKHCGKNFKEDFISKDTSANESEVEEGVCPKCGKHPCECKEGLKDGKVDVEKIKDVFIHHINWDAASDDVDFAKDDASNFVLNGYLNDNEYDYLMNNWSDLYFECEKEIDKLSSEGYYEDMYESLKEEKEELRLPTMEEVRKALREARLFRKKEIDVEDLDEVLFGILDRYVDNNGGKKHIEAYTKEWDALWGAIDKMARQLLSQRNIKINESLKEEAKPGDIGTQIGFSHDENPEDETEFDTSDEEEAKELFKDFIKENGYKNVKIIYIDHRTIEESLKEEAGKEEIYIKYWYDEDARDMGLSDIYRDNFATREEAIEVARKLVDRDEMACAEVFVSPNGEIESKDDKLIWGYDGVDTWKESLEKKVETKVNESTNEFGDEDDIVKASMPSGTIVKIRDNDGNGFKDGLYEITDISLIDGVEMYNLVNIEDSEDTNNNEPMDDTEVVFVAKDRKSLKSADAQRKAMFANGYKEGLEDAELKHYKVTMTSTSKKDEKELGIKGLKVNYEFFAKDEEDAKRQARKFDRTKRIVSIEEIKKEPKDESLKEVEESKKEKKQFAKKVVRPGVGFGDDDIDAQVQVNEAEAHAMIGDKPIVEENRKNNQKSEVEMANDFANTTMSTDSLQYLEDDDNI